MFRIFLALFFLVGFLGVTLRAQGAVRVEQFREKLSQSMKLRGRLGSGKLREAFDNMVNEDSLLINQLEKDLFLQSEVHKKTTKDSSVILNRLVQSTNENIVLIQEILDKLLSISEKQQVREAQFVFNRLGSTAGQKSQSLSKTASRRGKRVRRNRRHGPRAQEGEPQSISYSSQRLVPNGLLPSDQQYIN